MDAENRGEAVHKSLAAASEEYPLQENVEGGRSLDGGRGVLV